MNKKRQNIIYLLLILLIVLIIAVIGGLIMVLFSMSRQEQSSAPPVLPQAISNTPPAGSAVTERYIEAKPNPVPIAIKDVEEVSSGTAVVPAVCDGYGPQIQHRPAYKHKATYTASIQPNRITFTVYPDNSTPSNEADSLHDD